MDTEANSSQVTKSLPLACKIPSTHHPHPTPTYIFPSPSFRHGTSPLSTFVITAVEKHAVTWKQEMFLSALYDFLNL